MATRKVRYKKLNVKTPLTVLREDHIDPSEYEALTTETQIATGVESVEEKEFHLQAVLRGTGAAAAKEIPVPPPRESDVDYDGLYAVPFAQPSSYIRFSQTVEESIGCRYDMTEEDDTFLNAYNQGRVPAAQLSEDSFEAIMEVFEDTASAEAPYASVDNTVVSYDRMVPGLQELEAPKLMPHVKAIYEYWQQRRQDVGNRPLHPTLKFETHQENDDMDPYVCFRRREVRQTRKTRARDMQSADKLKRLRRELEEGRELVLASHQRERMKRELLTADRHIFEQRMKLKEVKVRLGIKADDDDLINQKPQKRKAPDLSAVSRAGATTQLRLPVRPDGRHMESDLAQLSAKLKERNKELIKDIEMKIENHRKWNQNHVDLTRGPLSPVPNPVADSSFRQAKTQYLMTPPASASSDSLEEPSEMALDQPAPGQVVKFQGAGKDEQGSTHQPSFRRRIGRLNRLWIDRRGLASPPRESSEEHSDRWKYDQDSDDDDSQPTYEVDPYDTRALKFRASIPLMPSFLRRPATADGAASGAAQVNGVGPAAARPALPAAGQ